MQRNILILIFGNLAEADSGDYSGWDQDIWKAFDIDTDRSRNIFDDAVSEFKAGFQETSGKFY